MEIDHSMDGQDPDQPQNSRYGPRGHAARLVEDLRELERMNEADVRHYTSTPQHSRNMRTNSTR